MTPQFSRYLNYHQAAPVHGNIAGQMPLLRPPTLWEGAFLTCTVTLMWPSHLSTVTVMYIPFSFLFPERRVLSFSEAHAWIGLLAALNCGRSQPTFGTNAFNVDALLAKYTKTDCTDLYAFCLNSFFNWTGVSRPIMGKSRKFWMVAKTEDRLGSITSWGMYVTNL